jgi:hypothetical protein
MTTESNQSNAAAGNKQNAPEIPDVILKLLSKPPLLPTESVPEFLEIFESFTKAIPLRNVLDYYLVFDITVLTFEVIRYRRMKIAILKNLERPVVEGFFRKTHEGSAMRGASELVAIEASQKAGKWMSDAAYRKTALKSFEVAGYGQDAVEAEAFVRALPETSSIERLIVSAQRRLNAFLKELTERHDKRVAAMRDTAVQAIGKAS